MKFYKVMEKEIKQTICIKPADTIVAEWAETLRIINDFKVLGFSTRDAFVNIVQELDPNYKDYRLVKNLQHLWGLRFRSVAVNQDLNKILEQLKAE